MARAGSVASMRIAVKRLTAALTARGWIRHARSKGQLDFDDGQLPRRDDRHRFGCDRSDQRNLLAVREERAAHAFVPDLVRQLRLLDLAIPAPLEEGDRVRQGEDRGDLQLARRFPAGLDQTAAQSLPLNV